MRSRWLAPVASLVVAHCLALDARAQPAESAQQLFERGVTELKAGRFEIACPALEASYAVESTLGSLLALADCFDRWGKFHSAALRYERYVAQVATSAPSDRAYRAEQFRFAEKALARLNAEAPHLLLTMPRAPPADLEVSLDGQALASLDAETDLRLDPGAHVLETRAAGHALWRVDLNIVPAERRSVELRLGAAPRLKPRAEPAPGPRPGDVRRVEPSGEATAPSSASSGWRSAGWVFGGLGLAGVAVATGAGIGVLRECPALKCSADSEHGRALALTADIGLGVGLVGLAASAIVLLQTAPVSRPNTARWQPVALVRPDIAWVGLGQRW